MEWSRIMAPLSGGEGDRPLIAAAAALAEPFGAELACVHAPADVADLIPWMGDGFLGGVQASVVESIRSAGAEGEQAARAAFEACGSGAKTFVSRPSPTWAGRPMPGRRAATSVFTVRSAPLSTRPCAKTLPVRSTRRSGGH